MPYKDPEKRREAARKASAKNRRKNRGTLEAKRRHLLGRYGITLDEYDALAVNGCMICGATPSEGEKRLCVDHDHETGKVRGILCMKCNLAIGYMQDDPTRLRKAAQYLEEL